MTVSPLWNQIPARDFLKFENVIRRADFNEELQMFFSGGEPVFLTFEVSHPNDATTTGLSLRATAGSYLDQLFRGDAQKETRAYGRG